VHDLVGHTDVVSSRNRRRVDRERVGRRCYALRCAAVVCLARVVVATRATSIRDPHENSSKIVMTL